MKNTLRAAFMASTLGACTSETDTPLKPSQLCIAPIDVTRARHINGPTYPDPYAHPEWKDIARQVNEAIKWRAQEFKVDICPPVPYLLPEGVTPIAVRYSVEGTYDLYGNWGIADEVNANSVIRIGGARRDLSTNRSVGLNVDCDGSLMRAFVGPNEPAFFHYQDGQAFARDVERRLGNALDCVLD